MYTYTCVCLMYMIVCIFSFHISKKMIEMFPFVNYILKPLNIQCLSVALVITRY